MSSEMVKRSDFVRHLVQHSGLTYVKAEQVYVALMRLMENSLAAKVPVNLGKIGVLVPVDLKPRRVVMGFKRKGGRGGGAMERCKSEFWLGARTRYVFRLHRSFGHNHGLTP